MKKAIIFALVLFAIMSVSALATETRTVVMGQNNNIMMDDANIWLYPSRINNYPNLALGEANWDAYDLYQVGVNWKFGEANPWVLGTYFSSVGDFRPTFYSGATLSPTLSRLGYFWDWDDYPSAKPAYVTQTTGQSFDLIYGRMLGGMNFGFSFGLNRASWTSEAEGDDEKESFSQYVLGLGLTSSQGDWDVAAKFGFGSFTDQNEEGEDESESDGYSDIVLMGRYFYKANNTVTFVPHATIWFGSRGVKYNDDNPGLDRKESRTLFEVGAGMNYTPITNVLAVLDFGVQYDKIKTEAEVIEDSTLEFSDTWTHLPYFRLGVEGEVFSWLDARMGVTSEWANLKVEDDFKASGIFNETYIGVGLNFNRLHIDTYMHPDVLLEGFDFINNSNDNDGDPMHAQLSILYEMF